MIAFVFTLGFACGALLMFLVLVALSEPIPENRAAAMFDAEERHKP